jgi:hypothetical protein
VRKGHRTSLAAGLAVLFLLIVSVLGSRFLNRDVSGAVSSDSDLPQSTLAGEPGGAAETPADASAGSTLAFTFDLDSSNPRRGSSSEGTDAGTKDDHQQVPQTTAAIGGSGAGEGTGGGNFGDVLFVGSTGIGPYGGGPAGGPGGSGPAGGGEGDAGGPGATPPGNGRPSNDDGPLSNGPGRDEPQLVSDWQPPGGGGGGPGGSGGPGGGPNGGVDDLDRFFPGNDPGDSTGGPSIATPIPTSDGTVPAPPTVVLLVGGLGLLWGARKIGQVAKRS